MIHTTQIWKIGDCVALMRELPANSIDTVVTSPPYWGLRDYGVDGQIGMESSLEEYHKRLLEVTAEIYRVMKPSAVLFWNHGDSYGGSGGSGGDYAEGGLREGQPKVGKSVGTAPKCLTMQNERLIMRMIDEQGWTLRNRIIWNKPNGMPSSVTDRFSNKYEPVYMLTKNKSYWFDLDAVRVPHKYTDPTYKNYRPNKVKHFNEGSRNQYDGKYTDSPNTPGDSYHSLGKNPGDVWTISTQPYPDSHFATFSAALIEPMIKAACPAEICPVCEMARERITETDYIIDNETPKSNETKASNIDNAYSGFKRMKFAHGSALHHTVGWTSCDCDAGWIAGTVLDPFCGSGTTLEVCRKLNRNAIGFELNPDYEPLIRKRSMAYNPPLSAFFGD